MFGVLMVSRSKAHSVRMGRVGAEEYAECTHLGIQEALGSVVLGGKIRDPSSHCQALVFFSFLTW